MNKTVAIVGLAAAFALFHKRALAGFGVMQGAQVYQLVKQVIARHGFSVSPKMVFRIAWIESHFDPSASRYEPHLNDASSGLMQTLLGTARWLARDMGYTAYGMPDMADLMHPEKSIYFGCAYLQWLSNYRGKRRSEEWIVRSYNGGPGNLNTQTAQYWEKYEQAKGEVG